MLRHVNNLERSAIDIIVKSVTRVVLGDDLRAVERRAAEQLHYLYTGNWAVCGRLPPLLWLRCSGLRSWRPQSCLRCTQRC